MRIEPAGSWTHDIACVWRRSRLEGLQNGSAAVSRAGAHAGFGIDPDQLDSGGHPERNRRLVGERKLHEISGDRPSRVASLSASAQTARLVVAKIETDHEIGRKADVPKIFCITGGAGLAGDRLAHFAHYRCRAALDHAFHHRGDLI